MPKSTKPLRVALMGRNDIRDVLHDITLGVLAYEQCVSHWQLVGSADHPVMDEAEVDLAAIDGLIGFFYERGWVEALAKAGVAAVNISSYLEDMPLPRVGSEDEAIGRMGGEHLLACGFVHFGFFDINHGWCARRRLTGFSAAIESQTGRTCHVFQPAEEGTDQTDTINRWVEVLPKPVAVLAVDDSLGRQLIDRTIALGLRVPDDVAVLGVNNNSWLTQLATVPMSSIAGNSKELGYQAAKMLDRQMTGEAHRSPLWLPPVGVVARQSTDIVISTDPIVGAALKYIRDHCHAGIGVGDVVKELHLSRRTLEVRLKRAVGYTPQVAIFRAQITRAKKMLLETDATMSRIADECGFDRDARFFLVFKRETGMTPGQYRRHR